MNKTIKERQKESETVVNKPLVSFCLFAYNQESYIREAVEGAFAQTYSPLEIILSDDCSADRTFEIMKEMAAGYKGPHTVILNRNEKNLGIGDHINKVVSLASGLWLVMAAGDDISYPERVSTCMRHIVHIPRAVAIVSRLDIIDPVPDCSLDKYYDYGYPSVTILEMSVQKYPTIQVWGCVAVWHRQLFAKPLPLGLVCEDLFLGLRSFCSGQMVFIPERLVKYRLSAGLSGEIGRRLRDATQSYADYLIWERQEKITVQRALFALEHIYKEFYHLRYSNKPLFIFFAKRVHFLRYKVNGGGGHFLLCCINAIGWRDVHLMRDLFRAFVAKSIGGRGRFYLKRMRTKEAR